MKYYDNNRIYLHTTLGNFTSSNIRIRSLFNRKKEVIMNKLTGKAKEDFYNYYYDNYLFNEGSILRHKSLSRIDTIVEKALILEFFDEKGYYFNRGLSFKKSKPYKCELYILDNDSILGECYDFKGQFLNITELKATEQAIIKANEIYNNK